MCAPGYLYITVARRTTRALLCGRAPSPALDPSRPLAGLDGAAGRTAALSTFVGFDESRCRCGWIPDAMNETTDATAIFAPLWRRKWLILTVGLLVAVATYVYYKHKPATYGASTQIYLGGGSVQALIGNTEGSSVQSDRNIADQVVLINSPLVGDAVRSRLLKEHKLAAAGGAAEANATGGASPTASSDFISISTKARGPQAAADLANTYAQVYLEQRKAHTSEDIQAALASTTQQLKAAQPKHGSPTGTQTLQIQDLVNRIDQLRSELSLGNAGNQQLSPAVANPTPLSPNPKRNAIFGFVIGVVLASIAAYALSRFDRRLRSADEIEHVCKVPVLTVVPSIRKPILLADGRPAPAQALLEPMRRLHTTLQLTGASHELNGQPAQLNGRSAPRSVLFISPNVGDGKSTLIAALALVQSEAGARVAIVESDLRRPVQSELLGVDGSRGLSDVLAGTVKAQDAMRTIQAAPVEVSTSPLNHGEGVATALQPRRAGSVSVLPSGSVVANPPALLTGQAMPALLRSLTEDYDYVLIDAPPPLAVSDVLPLLAMVDAIVIVARVGHTGETSARRLVDLLSRAPHAPVVGAVVNVASAADRDTFGLSSVYQNGRGGRGSGI